mgnify:CR=1 FL=1
MIAKGSLPKRFAAFSLIELMIAVAIVGILTMVAYPSYQDSIRKSRRADGAKAGGFLGAETILAQIANGVSKKRVGFLVDGRAPVREGAEIVDQAGNIVGAITSGGFGPTLQAPVAMGYVAIEFAPVGTKLNALVRGRSLPITVTKMPLVEQRYFRG